MAVAERPIRPGSASRLLAVRAASSAFFILPLAAGRGQKRAYGEHESKYVIYLFPPDLH